MGRAVVGGCGCSLQTLLCLQYRPEQVAVAVVDLSLRMLRAEVPPLGGRAWWQHCGVTAPQLEGARLSSPATSACKAHFVAPAGLAIRIFVGKMPVPDAGAELCGKHSISLCHEARAYCL